MRPCLLLLVAVVLPRAGVTNLAGSSLEDFIILVERPTGGDWPAAH